MTREQHRLQPWTPFFVALGATDLAVERLRDLGAAATGEDLDPSAPTGARAQLHRLVTGARQVPVLALNQAIDTMVRTQKQYDELAARGERLARRQPRVTQTEELLRHAGETVSRGRTAAADAAHEAGANLARTRDAAAARLHSAWEGADEVVEAVTHAAAQAASHAGSQAARVAPLRPVLRRGSVARGVRHETGPDAGAETSGEAPEKAASGDAEARADRRGGKKSRIAASESRAADPTRPRPRRPRTMPASAPVTEVSTGAPRDGEERQPRPAVPAGSQMEAAATSTMRSAGRKPASGSAKTSTSKATGKSTGKSTAAPAKPKATKAPAAKPKTRQPRASARAGATSGASAAASPGTASE